MTGNKNEHRDREGPKTRRGHSGFYEAATAREREILLQAFPLGEALQHAADAYLKDRRRYPDPESVRTIMRVRKDITFPESKQVRHRSSTLFPPFSHTPRAFPLVADGPGPLADVALSDDAV